MPMTLRLAISLQVGMMSLAGLTAGLLGGWVSAVSACYGGGVAACNVLLLWWRWRRGAKVYHCDGERHLRSFYRSSLERFFVVGLLLAIGFVVPGVDAPALLAGFVVGQLAWMLASLALRERL